MLGIGGFWLGLILSILAGLFLFASMVAGILWAWPYAKRVRLRWPVYIAPTEAELAKKWEHERFGEPVIENKSPGASQDLAQARERIEQLEAEQERLKSERGVLEDRVKGEFIRQESQPTDESLKQRCLQLSAELFQFLDEREKDDPHNTIWAAGLDASGLSDYSHKATLYTRETMRQYSKQFAGMVINLSEALKWRGWITAEEQMEFESAEIPSDIRDMAQRLSAIGHKL